MGEPGREVVFAAGECQTTVTMVKTTDIAGVERALEGLLQHRVLGLCVRWTAEHVGVYHGVSVIALSGGSETVIFQLETPEMMPVGLRLLLSHQEYVLIATDVVSLLVGRMWRDFGLVLLPCHDVGDILLRRFGSTDLLQGFRRHCLDAAYIPAADIEASHWNAHDLSYEQQDHLAFEAYAGRFLWLKLANPRGLPPKLLADTKAADALGMVDSLGCPDCPFRPDSQRSLDTHMQLNHHFPCDLCGQVEPSEAARQRHKEMRHECCAECGVWLLNDKGMRRHRIDFHQFACELGCHQSFATEKELLSHLNSCHSFCTNCQEWFTDMEVLALHAERDHPTCPVCQRQFRTQTELQQHRYARVNGQCYTKTPGQTGRAQTMYGIDTDRLDSSASSVIRPLPRGAGPANHNGMSASPYHTHCRYATAPTSTAASRSLRNPMQAMHTATELDVTRMGASLPWVASTPRTPATSSRLPRSQTSPRHESSGASSPRLAMSDLHDPIAGPALCRATFASPAQDRGRLNESVRFSATSTSITVGHHQASPGDMRWVAPPYRQNTPLKIARTADAVGEI